MLHLDTSKSRYWFPRKDLGPGKEKNVHRASKCVEHIPVESVDARFCCDRRKEVESAVGTELSFESSKSSISTSLTTDWKLLKL
jgi:hypothetical protein